MTDGLEIPHQRLPPEILRAVIEEFVTREGTEYGLAEVSLEAKVNAVMAQLTRGTAVVLYDPESQTTTLEVR